jgi:hypothetical protein
MRKFLVKLFWIIIPIIIGLIGGYLISVWQQKDMELTAYIYPERVVIDTLLTTSIKSDSQLAARPNRGFRAYFGDKEIDNLKISFVEIKNTGDLPIQEIPLNFSFPGSKLLEYSASLPLGMKDYDMIEISRAPSSLELLVSYLNVDESIAFDFKLDATSGQRILVNSRHQGMRFIERKTQISEPNKELFHINEYFSIIVLVATMTLTFSTLLLFFMKFSRIQKKD